MNWKVLFRRWSVSQNREALQDVRVSQGARPKGKGFAMDVLLYYV